MKTLLKGWTNFWGFIAGAFQDDEGHTSATRISGYVMMWELCYYINSTVKCDPTVLLQLALIIGALYGIKVYKDIKAGDGNESSIKQTETVETTIKTPTQ